MFFIYIVSLYAQIPINRIVNYVDESGALCVGVQRNVQLEERRDIAALAAAASYNTKEKVAFHNNVSGNLLGGILPKTTRNQSDDAFREKLVSEGYNLVNFYSKTCGKDVPAGIIAYKRDDNGKLNVFVSYHGTESGRDLLTDLNMFSGPSNMSALNPSLNVDAHCGFLSRYIESRESVHDILDFILEGQSLDEVSLNVSGHSLGGALATLAAADIKTKYHIKDTKLFTFSSPRVVKGAGAENIEKLLGKDNTYRYWRSGDPISTVTPGIFGYKHVGQSLQMEGKGFSMENHSMEHYINEIESKSLLFREEEDFSILDYVRDNKIYTPNTQHKGIRTQIKEKAKSVSQGIFGFGKKILGKIF